MSQSYKQFLAASAKRRAKVMELRTLNVSPADIARRFKISPQRVAKIIAKESKGK